MIFNLSLATDTAIAYFSGFAMTALTIMLITEEYPQLSFPVALSIGSAAFVTAAVFSFGALLTGEDFNENLWYLLLIVFISAFLPALGSFNAALGNSFFTASTIGVIVLVINAFAHIPVTQGASMFGSMAGSIAAGHRCNNESPNLDLGIMFGIVFGVILSILWTLSILAVVVFSVSSLSVLIGGFVSFTM